MAIQWSAAALAFAGFLLASCIAGTEAQNSGKCPAGWLGRPDSNWCYEFVGSNGNFKGWDDAKQACETQHGMLLALNDIGEREWVARELNVFGSSFLWWFGLERSTGAWRWTDGHTGNEAPGSSTSDGRLLTWLTGNSDSTPGNCMTIQGAAQNSEFLYVFPRNCNNKAAYVCQKQKQDATTCDSDDGWETHGDRCYKIFSNKLYWEDARESCNRMESDLATVKDQATSVIIRDIVNRGSGAIINTYWIGLRTQQSTSDPSQFSWRWVDDSVVVYKSWSNGLEPQPTSGLCAHTEGTDPSRQWRQYACNGVKFGFICSRPTGTCANGWYQHRDTCYSLNPTQLSWNQASEHCQSYGATLMRVKQDHVQKFINVYREDFVKNGIDYIWIGMYRAVSESGEIKWTSGDLVSTGYTNWADRQPQLDNSRANAGRIFAADDGGRWQVANPTEKGGFVCEIPLGKTPLVPTTVYPSFVCEPGWLLYGSRCYKLESEKFVDWLTARSNCQKYPGADLIDIRGRSEQEFIQKQLDPRRDYWIGLHTRSTEDRSWLWVVDNSPLDYSNWQQGEPNNMEKEENCVEMYTFGLWNDNRCTYRLPYICKVLASVNGSPRPTLPGTTTPNFDPFCGPLWRRDPTSSYCYLFNTDPLIWFDAKHQCEFQGGKLVSIVTQEEKAYIAARIKSMKDEDNGILGFWLGFNDRAEEGNWVWDDGQPVTFLNWAAGEPNNAGAGEDCGVIYADSALWNDFACEKRYASICKKLGNVLITIQPPPATTIEVPNGYLRGCRDGYSVHNNMCYKVYTSFADVRTWHDAKTKCESDGGDLASVMNLAEQQFLQELASPNNYDYWIGFYDSIAVQRIMYFKWTDTSKPTFTYWLKGEPNNYADKEDCVEILNSQAGWNGRWNDQNCEEKRRFACKQRQIPVLVLPPVTKPPGCPNGYNDAYGGYCMKYVVDGPLITAFQAKALCGNDGGLLASIPTVDVQNHIFLRLTELRATSNFWIGLVQFGRSFRWEDGRPFSYSNWKPNSILYGVQGLISPLLGLWEMSLWISQSSRNYICQVGQVGYSTPTMPPTTYNPAYCASGWIEANGNCYRGFSATQATDKKSWPEARALCQSLNGDLASIQNNETMKELEKTVGGTIGYWIGLNTRDSNKGFVWADGSPVGYFSWRGDKQPENINGNQNCGVLSPSDMSWVIDNCNAAMNWLCEMPKGIYPTGSTIEPTTAPDAPDCGEGWKYYNGYCYMLSTNILEWHNALQYCRGLKSDLVSIHDNEETDFLLRLTSKLHISFASYWIGLNELGQNGGWWWTDGTGANYFNWNAGEPNNAGGAEHCASFYSSNGLWNDDQCGELHRFICKRSNDTSRTEAPVTPMPGYCPKWYFRVGDKCFRIYEDQALSWSDARQVCERPNPEDKEFRGYLASISSEYEQAILASYRSYNDSNLWIGLFARYNMHLYYWHDNSPFKYSNWAYNEPNNKNEKCVHMYTERFRAGQWNDADCNRKMGFICMTYKYSKLVTDWKPPTSTICEANWQSYGSSCYRYLPSATSWNEAQSACRRIGGNLASIHDVWEQNFAHYMTESIANIPTWIGLSDQRNRGVYEWSDLWHLTYVNWGQGQPGNNEQSTCVQMDKTGAWFATNCTTPLPALCRKSNGPMPTTQPHIDGTCPPGFVPQFDSCYLAANVSVGVTAPVAQVECQRLYRANLVSILSESEQNFVASLINEKNQQTTLRRDYWIGLLRTDRGGFEWNDHSPLGYVYWSMNEPSNGANENCVEMYNSNKKWNDHFCSKLNSYVCKMPKIPSTDTRTTATTTGIRTTRTTVGGQTRQTEQPTTTRIGTTQGPILRAIEDLKNDALVGGAVVLFLALLLAAVLAVFFYRRRVGSKSSGGAVSGEGESGFANANWSSATNEVSLETGKADSGGLSNPSFAGAR